VIWELGALPLLGFGIDPMGLLVPFLVFAIGVSHGVQMISGYAAEVYRRRRRGDRRAHDVPAAARARRHRAALRHHRFHHDPVHRHPHHPGDGDHGLARRGLHHPHQPGAVAGADQLRRAGAELQGQAAQPRQADAAAVGRPVERWSTRGPATIIIAIAAGLFVFGAWKGSQVRIGDLHAGVPELRPDSRYNLDSQDITDRFSIGVDLINVIVEVGEDGCINYEVMDVIDRFAWHMQNVPGVQTVVALPQVAKIVTAGWNEGYPAWRVLSRNEQVLVQALARVETSTGLLNSDCSVIPVMVYTVDHKAETIERVIQEVKDWRERSPSRAWSSAWRPATSASWRP
jgi:uncharacterized protein